MISIDDIDKGWNETAYVWLRPAEGTDWESITDHWSDRRRTEFRPALIVGFTEDQWAYGTHNDTRQVKLIGQTYSYPHAKFEIGGIMEPDFVIEAAPSAPSPAPAL